MNNLDWKTRLLIYLIMKKYTPSAPGWLVVLEQAWRLQNTIAYLGFSLASSSSVDACWQPILSTWKSGLRSSRYYLGHLCYSSTLQSMIKMSPIDKDYAFICTNEEDAIQAVREHGGKQEILCLRPRTQWPTQADTLW